MAKSFWASSLVSREQISSVLETVWLHHQCVCVCACVRGVVWCVHAHVCIKAVSSHLSMMMEAETVCEVLEINSIQKTDFPKRLHYLLNVVIEPKWFVYSGHTHYA
jgi:hypothetical protein